MVIQASALAMAVSKSLESRRQRPSHAKVPSDGCGRDGVLLAVERWYDFRELGAYLVNVG